MEIFIEYFAIAKGESDPSMEFLYTATDFYELDDITPASWQAAVDRYEFVTLQPIISFVLNQSLFPTI